jgi:nucleoside phosphorylase
MKAHVTNLQSNFDIVFLTALPHVEYEAVMKLPLNWTEHQEVNDDNVYHSAVIELADGSVKKVLATSLSHMGIAAAAAATASICVKFKPSLIVMTGICAGVKGRVEIGDILVADPSWDWGSGKLTIVNGVAKFLSAPTQVALDPALRRKIQHVATSNAYMNTIYANWTGTRPPTNPSVHVGPVATGAVVLEDPQTVDLIRAQNRTTNGVEMEAYGVMAAAFNSGPNRPKVLAVKSVCDFADPEKNNDWQHYAAHTSTQFAYMFIKDHLAI